MRFWRGVGEWTLLLAWMWITVARGRWCSKLFAKMAQFLSLLQKCHFATWLSRSSHQDVESTSPYRESGLALWHALVSGMQQMWCVTAEPGLKKTCSFHSCHLGTLGPPWIEIQAGPLKDKRPSSSGKPPIPNRIRSPSWAYRKLLTHRIISKQKWCLTEDTKLWSGLLCNHSKWYIWLEWQTQFPFPKDVSH